MSSARGKRGIGRMEFGAVHGLQRTQASHTFNLAPSTRQTLWIPGQGDHRPEQFREAGGTRQGQVMTVEV